MTSGGRLSAADMGRAMMVYRDGLRAHRDAINRLNVYPVPDGDTGTNMALTLEAVVRELDGADAGEAATAKAIAHGSLMGARGNSGVILSQVLRGMAGVWGDQAGADGADGATVAAALAAASEAADGAVMRPVEGTILTVVRDSATAARERADAGADLAGVLDAARAAGQESLERTPELLKVLADAGVVDAGGAGFLLLLDALLHVVIDRPMPEPPDHSQLAVAGLQAAAHGGDGPGGANGEGDVSDLRYEVMYFLEAPDEAVPEFKHVWAGIGDSIVVVGGDGIWNCHIHTDNIGAAIEAALDCGRPREIRVTDLLEQVEEERWVREGSAAPEEAVERAPVTTAVVAIATGDGIRRIFHSLGVQGIVTGGQSMNPATEDILAAVEAAPSDSVVVLPNNKNIVPVAEQVDALTTKSVRVVPTRGIAEGFAALLAYDPEAPVGANAEEMGEAAHRVAAGEVTRAVRDSHCELGPIAEGDYLGLCREGIKALAPNPAAATIDLIAALLDEDHEIVTLIEGEGSSAADTRKVTEAVSDRWPAVTCEVHQGGQPLYPYLVGIE